MDTGCTLPDYTDTRITTPFIRTAPSTEWNNPLDSMDNLPMDSNASNQIISDSMGSGNRIPFSTRGIKVPTGFVGNILPGEKYRTEYAILQRNDNPDFNQITTNPSLGYSFIQNTPTSVEVSTDSLYNKGFEFIQKIIRHIKTTA